MDDEALASTEKLGSLAQTIRGIAEKDLGIRISAMPPSERFQAVVQLMADVDHKFSTGYEHAVWFPVAEGKSYVKFDDPILKEAAEMAREERAPWSFFLKNVNHSNGSKQSHVICQMDPGLGGVPDDAARAMRARYVFGFADHRYPEDECSTDFGFFCVVLGSMGMRKVKEDFTYDMRPIRAMTNGSCNRDIIQLCGRCMEAVPQGYGKTVEEFVAMDIKRFREELAEAGMEYCWGEAVQLYADTFGNGLADYIKRHFACQDRRPVAGER